MRMFLTSYGFNSPIVLEKLRKVIDAEGKTIIVFPYAGFNADNTYLREKQGLINFGFDEKNIILGSPSNIARISKVDYLYVPGGDTFKLLDFIQSNKMLEHMRCLVESGSIYIGVSAGAALATVDLEYVTVAEDNNFSFVNYTGLGFCNDIVIPHSDQISLSVIANSRQLCSQDRNLLLIKNDDVIEVNL